MLLIVVSILLEGAALFCTGSMILLSQHNMLTHGKMILWSFLGACFKVAWVAAANSMGSDAYQSELSKFFASKVFVIRGETLQIEEKIDID